MLDVLNTVGLSNSLLRVIDRRHKMDRWLTYGGMVRAHCLHRQQEPAQIVY